MIVRECPQCFGYGYTHPIHVIGMLAMLYIPCSKCKGKGTIQFVPEIL